MTSLDFCNQIATEQDRIKARREELNQALRAMNEERRALEEREQALDAVSALYKSSQQTVDEAIAIQAGICAAATGARPEKL